jgi:hypothetical protein
MNILSDTINLCPRLSASSDLARLCSVRKIVLLDCSSVGRRERHPPVLTASLAGFSFRPHVVCFLHEASEERKERKGMDSSRTHASTFSVTVSRRAPPTMADQAKDTQHARVKYHGRLALLNQNLDSPIFISSSFPSITMAVQPSEPAPLSLSSDGHMSFHSKEDMLLSKKSRNMSLHDSHPEHDTELAHQRSDTQTVSDTSLKL